MLQHLLVYEWYGCFFYDLLKNFIQMLDPVTGYRCWRCATTWLWWKNDPLILILHQNQDLHMSNPYSTT